MDVVTVTTTSGEHTRALGRAVAAHCEAGDVILLAGELGAGKTTFVQGLASGLGIDEPVRSPTFVLARPYRGRLRLVHVDVYRLDHLGELDDLGLFEPYDDDPVTVVEWGDAVAGRLPAERLEVRLERSPDLGDPDARRVTITAEGPSWARRVAALGTSAGGGA